MAGQFPSNIEFSSVELISLEKVLTSVSQSGARQARLIGGQLWAIKFRTNPMLKAVFNPLYSFLMRQKGRYDTFTIVVPGHDVPLGQNEGSPTWTSTTNDNTINTGGWSASIANQAMEGDVFTIAGSTKVYMLTADASSDGAGNATLSFYPALRDTPSAGAALTFNNVVFTVQLTSPKVGYKRQGILYNLDEIDLVEALI